jgi:hypothetical protein
MSGSFEPRKRAEISIAFVSDPELASIAARSEGGLLADGNCCIPMGPHTPIAKPLKIHQNKMNTRFKKSVTHSAELRDL